MFAFLAAGAPSFASTPHAMCPEPKLAAQPPVAGVMPGFGHKAHVLLGAAPDYPPYTGWAGTVPDDPTTSGFNVEVGLLAEPICGIKIDFIFAPWSECWTAKPESVYFDQATEYVGESLYKGYVHGCTAYTHTKGERNWSLEFTHSILAGLKTGGIITRLDADGNPVVSPTTYNYTGIKLGDVQGWAPTPGTFGFNKNYCVAGEPQFTGMSFTTLSGDGNDIAIDAVLDGTIDALYIYADQLKNWIKDGTNSRIAQFGKPNGFAYIHTGLNEWSLNGTTLAVSKKGSGLAGVLNPCIEKIVASPDYMAVCNKYWGDSASTVCIGGADTLTKQFVDQMMHEKTEAKTCADGYCPCP